MKAVLHVVSDRQRNMQPLEAALVEAVAGGADVIQIRDKKAPAQDTFSLCRSIQSGCAVHGLFPTLLVNDRVDVAMAAGLNGVHLAGKSLPVPAVHAMRDKYQWPGIVGVSVHSLEEAHQAEQDGADYITFGHIFDSESHAGEPPRGLFALARVVEAVSIPVIAIGGITVQNVASVLDTGCAGVAVIGGILQQPDVRIAAQRMKEQMTKASRDPKVPFPSYKPTGGGCP